MEFLWKGGWACRTPGVLLSRNLSPQINPCVDWNFFLCGQRLMESVSPANRQTSYLWISLHALKLEKFFPLLLGKDVQHGKRNRICFWQQLKYWRIQLIVCVWGFFNGLEAARRADMRASLSERIFPRTSCSSSQLIYWSNSRLCWMKIFETITPMKKGVPFTWYALLEFWWIVPAASKRKVTPGAFNDARTASCAAQAVGTARKKRADHQDRYHPYRIERSACQNNPS